MTISDEIRKFLIESYLKESLKQVSSIFGKQYHTVRAIIWVYKKEDRFKQKRKGGQRNKKLVEEQMQMIQSWIDEDCRLTLKSIQFSISVCLNSVDNLFLLHIEKC